MTHIGANGRSGGPLEQPVGSEVRFGGRLVAAVAAFGNLCAGVDPHPSLLAEWGLTDDVEGLARFCDAVSYTHLTLPTTPYV